MSQVAEQHSPSFPCTHLSHSEECSLLHRAWELLADFLKLYNCESLLKVTLPSCEFRVKSSSGACAPSSPAPAEMKGTVLSFKYLKLGSFWYFPRFLSSAFSDAFVQYRSAGNWTSRYNVQHLQYALQNWVISLGYLCGAGISYTCAALLFFPLFRVTAPLCRRGTPLPPSATRHGGCSPHGLLEGVLRLLYKPHSCFLQTMSMERFPCPRHGWGRHNAPEQKLG